MAIDQQTVMRRLERLLRTDTGLCMSVREIEETTGIAGRTLRQHYQRWWGTCLRSYIRTLRLARIRRELQRFDSLPGSIAEIAAQHGMREPGRFAVQYRSQFGESPSATLKRTKLRKQRGLVRKSAKDQKRL